MGGIAMGRAGIDIRSDFDAAQLRMLASHSRDANQARRLLSLAAIYDGMNRKDAAMVGGPSRRRLACLPGNDGSPNPSRLGASF